MMRVGMNQSRRIACDCNMPFPEYEISASKVARFAFHESVTKLCLLHVAVAWRGNPACTKRSLHEPRTINAEAAFAAPQIGGFQKALRHADIIRFASIN